MGVYNGADELPRTMDTLLAEQEAALEFVIVDDGSTDATWRVLGDYAARDTRFVLLRQEHAGLTAALVRGCAHARGRAIARQDSGDVSLPGRFIGQLRRLDENPRAVMVTCGSRYVGMYGETLRETHFTADDVRRGLKPANVQELRGPSSHGSVMMRADAYRAVGGYRRQFRVAQDVDLWLRLAEVGEIEVVPDALYAVHLAPGSISATRRAEQFAYARIAVAAHLARTTGGNEFVELEGAEKVASSAKAEPSGWRRRWLHAAFLYLLGRSQSTGNGALARRYFRSALKTCPWHWRSLAASVVYAIGRR